MSLNDCSKDALSEVLFFLSMKINDADKMTEFCDRNDIDALSERVGDVAFVYSTLASMIRQSLKARELSAIEASPATVDQPMPSGDGPAVWPLVIEDMRERDAAGRARYGVPLRANNGRDALVDAYQEALDLAVYLRQAIAER